MNLLFILSSDTEEFLNLKDAKKYFKSTLPSNNNYFFVSKNMLKLKSGDTIYFAYNHYIIAKAIFTGKEKSRPKINSKFNLGYKLSDIKLIKSLKIDYKKIKIGGSMIYVTEEIQNEINKIIGDIYE